MVVSIALLWYYLTNINILGDVKMEANIKSLTNQYFSNVFFWWLALVVTIYMFSIPEASEGLFKYVISALSLYTGLKFFFSIYKVFNFMEKNKKAEVNEDILKDILPTKEIKQRSVFNYLNRFPAEHPYLLLSIIGLIIMEQYTSFSGNFHQSIENIPILNSIFPSLLFVILFMIFSDYTYHINAKYIRRAIKIVIFIYSPFIIGFFFLGLLSPFILIIKGMLNIASIQDVLLFFSNIKNLFWFIVYPWTAFYLLKCTFIENQQMIEVK